MECLQPSSFVPVLPRGTQTSSFCHPLTWTPRWQPLRVHAATASSATSAASASSAESATSAKSARKRVVVVGGSGRVGGSTALALQAAGLTKEGHPIDVVVAGRSRERAGRVLNELEKGGGAEFAACDTSDDRAIRTVIEGADLVVHTAGPFQQTPHCQVLEAAIEAKVPYIDVCDDVAYSKRAKSLHEKAQAAGVPAITTAGIYPGVSNIMAAELVQELRRGGDKDSSIGVEPKRLRFSYYTAGSGGAGPTILSTSFLLLGEDTIAFKDGQKVLLRSYSGGQTVDFGKFRGKKRVYLLNLPEVSSCFETLGVPTVSARFGTDPMLWNLAMQAVGLLPRSFLQDQGKVKVLAQISDPLVRLVDKAVGERMSMRVDVDGVDGKRSVGLYNHKKLSVCVGHATAAFALAVLEGSTQPGVWFPEEEGGVALKDRPLLLERSAAGCSTFVMHKSPWMVESTPKEIGFGIYIE